MKNKIKFKKAINLALSNAMKKDKDVLIMGWVLVIQKTYSTQLQD